MFLNQAMGIAPRVAAVFPRDTIFPKGSAFPNGTASAMLAHQGGWDEVLLVAVPLSIIGGLLWIANRRVSAQLAQANNAAQATDSAESADEDQDPPDSTPS